MQDELVVQLEIDTFSPYVGYPVVRRLLQRTRDFTALFVSDIRLAAKLGPETASNNPAAIATT